MSPPPPSSRASSTRSAPRTSVVDKREAILEAALDLFVERGFHGTAVPEIAERAGVGAGTIYRYFPSKEAIVNAIYQEHKAALVGSVLRDFPVDKPARQMIHHLWSRMVDFALGQPRAFAFLELHHHASYLDEQSKAIEARIIDMGVRFLQLAQQRGEVKPNIEPMLLIAIVHGIFVGVIRKAEEGLLKVDAAALAIAEQCAWEAVRA